MPQAAIAGLANFFLYVFAGTSAAATAAAFFVAKVFVYAASTYLLNRAAQSLSPKPKSAGLGTGTEVNYYDSGASVRICYGQVKTGGMETIPPMTTSKPNSNAFEDLHKVLTLAGHEIDSYNFTHFDTTTITNAQIGPMAFTMSDGLVSSGAFDQHAFIRHYRGTSTDSSDRFLTQISSTQFGNARARGIAKAAITLRFNADVYKSVPTITFTFQGKRCYDPRLDASPGAAPTNPSFIAWTRTPALCLADYLMSDLGGSYASTDIDWDTVVTAANYCDGSVNIPGPSTQARYTCNGVLFATAEFTDNVKALVDTMLGRVIFRDGKWRMYAGSWQTPTFTITKSDWISGLSIRFEQGRKKRFNQMRTWYVDANREWQRLESLPRINTTFRTADGEETIDAETEQLLCTHEFEAQRKGEFLLRQSRNQITVAGRLPPRFQNIALWDTGTIVFDHLGWASKTFRAVGLDMNPDGSMDCVFAEEQSGDWTDLDAADYNSLSDALLPAANATKPTEPPAFTAAPQINGTILFGWTRPIVQPFNTEFQIIRSTNSADASVGTVVWQGNTSPVALVMPTSPHWYYVRAVANSELSPYQPNTFGILAIARPEADNTEAKYRIVSDGEFKFGSAASFWVTSAFLSDPSTMVYVHSGGPFGGGYFTLTKVSSLASSVRNQLSSTHAVNSLGFRVPSVPTVAKIHMTIRVNSGHVPSALVFSDVRVVARDMLPDGTTLNAALPSGAPDVRSSDVTAVGTWIQVTRQHVIAEPDSINTIGRFLHARITGPLSTGGTGQTANVDIGGLFVEADQTVGQEPIVDNELSNGSHNLFWFDSLRTQVMVNTSNDASLFFFGTEWKKFPNGTRFTVFKKQTVSAVYLLPSSGVTNRIAGTALTGTALMVESLYGYAHITKVSSLEFSVSGNGLRQ